MIKIDYEIIRSNMQKLYKTDYLVLKSNAYGFGFRKVLDLAIEEGFYKFAVLSLKDAIYIKQNYQNTKVLLLGTFDPKNLYDYEKYRIEISLNAISELKSLYMHQILIQIAVNTGMNRFGIKPEEVNPALQMIEKTNLRCTGIYSHNATSNAFYQEAQINAFLASIDGVTNKDIHFAASSFIGRKLPYVTSRRIGDALYYNALSFYGKIVKINHLQKEEYIGYEYAYKMPMEGNVAIVDIGYADGIPRKSNGFLVYINNRYYYMIGNSCMNHSFILLKEDMAKVGDLVHFISPYNNIIHYQNFFGKSSHEIYLDLLKKY